MHAHYYPERFVKAINEQGGPRVPIDEVGIEHVMLGSDYCFDMGYDRPREVVDALRLRPAEKEKIYAANAARLLRL